MSSLKSVSVLVQKILPKLLWPIYLTLKYDLDLCMSPIKMCSLMRYICMPIMKSLSGLVKKLWTMLKLVIWPIYLTADLEGWPWPWHVCTQNVRLHEIHMHAKYEVSTCIISKVMANVKVGHKQTNRWPTNKQTGQKQYAPQIYLERHKKGLSQGLIRSLHIWKAIQYELIRC